MVLRPIFDGEAHITDNFIPAWNAVEAQEKTPARDWLLITQPDHAALSGDIAAHFSAPQFPAPDPEIVRAIAMHDAGWSLFESDPHASPAVHPDGRPVSFFEVAPGDFLRAWTASIDRAAEDSARGAYMVSQHFSSLGEYRLQRMQDPPAVREQLSSFLKFEARRRNELNQPTPCDSLLPLLQFCDLFSLYLCSGTRQPVEFPQDFTGGRIRAHFDATTCVLLPTPFSSPASFSFRARRYPSPTGETVFTSVTILVR